MGTILNIDPELDLADLMQRIDRMNAEQRRIIGALVSTLQSFNDDRAARRWIEQHEQLIRAELKRAQ